MRLFGGICIYCKRRVIKGADLNIDLRATVDHDTPKCRCLSQPLYHTNTVLCCQRCNSAKGDMTGPEFIAFLQTGRLAETYIRFVEERLVKRLHLKLEEK